MRKKLFSTICIIICIVLFTARYIQVNSPQVYKVKNSYYKQGDVVDVGKNILVNGNMDGYQITVVESKIWKWEKYLEYYKISFNDSEQIHHPERVYDVIIKIKNNNTSLTEDQGIHLMQFYIQSNSFLASVNQELLFANNPFLEKAIDIALKPETEKEIHLPFSLYKENFRKNIWNDLENYPFYFVATLYPEKKCIILE